MGVQHSIACMAHDNPRILRVDVLPIPGSGLVDSRANALINSLPKPLAGQIAATRTSLGYTIKGDFTEQEATHAATNLFSDPIIETFSIDGSIGAGQLPDGNYSDLTVQVGFKPGVTDNRAMAAEDGLGTIFPNKSNKVASTISYHFWLHNDHLELDELVNQLHNPMLEEYSILDGQNRIANLIRFPNLKQQNYVEPRIVNLDVDDRELERISDDGLLALNLLEMKAIQGYFKQQDTQEIRSQYDLPADSPTDVELECLAQTWSEHCSHKIFSAKIQHTDNEDGTTSTIDSLFKTHIVAPTNAISKEVDWLLSVFHDNSGVIAWTDEWSLCMKAETHNSPSALDPFGGAMTGIVGVNRDILGTGLGAKPIANTDVFCFGPPDYSGTLPKGLFPFSHILRSAFGGKGRGQRIRNTNCQWIDRLR